ncbi:MAG: MFS transporter [Candidatus Micrarchaeota archaeon]
MLNKKLSSCYAILFSHNLIRNFAFFLFPLFFISIGLGGFETGLLMGILTISGLLFSFYIGMKSDQIKQTHLLAIGTILFFIFCAGLIFFQNIWILILLFIFGGTGTIILNRVGETLAFKFVNYKKKGWDMAVLQGVKTLSFISGVVIGAIIVNYFGFSILFAISAILTLLSLVLVFGIKETKLFHFPTYRYLNDFKNKKVLLFCLIIFIFCLHFGAEQTSYSPFLKYNLGLGMLPLSLFIAGAVVFLFLTGFACGHFIDKGTSAMKIMAGGMLLSGIGGTLFAMTDNVLLSFIFRALHEAGDGAFLLMIFVGIVSLFGKKRIGGTSGLVTVVMILATFFGSIIFGPIGFEYGFQFPHIISGIFSIIAFVLMLIFAKKEIEK